MATLVSPQTAFPGQDMQGQNYFSPTFFVIVVYSSLNWALVIRNFNLNNQSDKDSSMLLQDGKQGYLCLSRFLCWSRWEESCFCSSFFIILRSSQMRTSSITVSSLAALSIILVRSIASSKSSVSATASERDLHMVLQILVKLKTWLIWRYLKFLTLWNTSK